ncbi:MAG: lysyl-tRNA synthetase, class [Actinomycetota bacterium]|nr:lysyl-tRNA synthetase, class [Actinomycetota bacterium]
MAAALIGVVGLVNLLSALTPPAHGRLLTLLDLMPLQVPQTAAALVALAGLALLLLARGIVRGQRRAWVAALGLLIVSALLNVVKGFDVEEAAISAIVVMYLVARHASFRAPSDHLSLWRGLVAVAVVAAGAMAVGVAAIEVAARPRPPLGFAIQAVGARLVGLGGFPLPDRVSDFLNPSLLATGFGLVAVAGWVLVRPVVPHRSHEDDLDHARRLIARGAGDTLSYFALRNDKQFFFSGESVVAYAVIGGVALVSPDPDGPVDDRDKVWAAFRAFADRHGWSVAVLGATEEWLDVYKRAGMRDVYIGDEAIVDCATFCLEGGKKKGLRQAVNRVARHGYHVEFFDPAHVDPALQPELRRLMAESRQGASERGFSMTLGRIFHPEDCGLLLAVAFAPDGSAAAMCQFVPAPAIGGYSLDLMRRSLGDHPNGLTDFVVVETIRRLAAGGGGKLALNFAAMRAVLAGEKGDGKLVRVQRWLLERFSETMQIESLRYYNEKFSPTWRPRYALYDAPEHFMAALTAVARAESVTELPFVGRFLRPVSQPV